MLLTRPFCLCPLALILLSPAPPPHTHTQMVVTHSVSTGVRWYEIRGINSNGLDGAPTLFQQGTFPSPQNVTRWFGTVAMDKIGNIGLGYAESGSSLYPSVGIAGRGADAPLGSMPLGPTRVADGVGSLSCTCARFGDYASMQVTGAYTRSCASHVHDPLFPPPPPPFFGTYPTR